MGAKFVVVCVNFKENELDRTAFSEAREILEQKLAQIPLSPTAIIPISVHRQENIFVNNRDTFYTGTTFPSRSVSQYK